MSTGPGLAAGKATSARLPGEKRKDEAMGMRIVTAAAAAMLVLGAPATAQMSNSGASSDHMSSGSMSSGSKKMSMADKKMMTKCKGMSHDMMMKDKSCAKMMKMHPDMMQGG